MLSELVAKPFADLDLLAIHFEAESLQDRADRGSEDGVPYTDDVLAALGDVTRLGPGLTLGHPAVDLYIARVREAREARASAADEAAFTALSKATQADSEAIGPRSRAMDARIEALEDPAERLAAQRAKQTWTLWTLGTLASLGKSATKEVAKYTLLQTFGPAIVKFIKSNAASLLAVAAALGGPWLLWIPATLGPIFLALWIKQEIAKRKPAKPRKRR